MSRVFRTSLWTCILALGFLLGALAAQPRAAHALDAPAVSDDTGSGGGTGGGTSYGDPDAPSGDSKRAGLRGAGVPVGSSTIAGDDLDLQSAWMWRLRIVLQSLRGVWILP